jgi:hypothetical protein
MKRIVFILLVSVWALALAGCVTSNPNSEVMIDTSSKTKKNLPDGASEPGDFEKMSDPFLIGN